MYLYWRTGCDVNTALAPPWTNQRSPLEGHRKQRRLLHYNSSSCFLPPPYPPLNTALPPTLFPFSSLFCLPFFLFHFLTPFPLITLEHLPSPSAVPCLILSVPPCRRLFFTLSHFFIHLSLMVSLYVLSFLLWVLWGASLSSSSARQDIGAHLLPWPLSAHQSPCQILPHGWTQDRLSPPGNKPLYPGLSNGLEGAMSIRSN